MLTCVILDDYQGVALTSADWSTLTDRVAITAVLEHVDDTEALVEMLTAAEIVVVMRERTPFGADLIARLPRLKLIITSGMRNASIDLAAAKRRGITVCGTGSSSTPPAELTWTLILGLARHLQIEAPAFRSNGPWQSTIGVDLAGQTLGLVGLGKIGTQVARVGQAFGMNVQAWSPHLTDERAGTAGVRRVSSMQELLRSSDVISLHLVLGHRTRGLIDADSLAECRPHTLLINTSRAGLVDQDALVRALRSGSIAGAGLDVFDQEPLPHDHPYRTLPNVLATPHLGYVTEGNYRSYFVEAVEDIEAFLANTPIRELSAS